MKIKIKVKYLASNYTIELNNSDSILHLKDKISKILNIDLSQQVLIYNDRMLNEDYKNLEDLEINDESVIFVKKRGVPQKPVERSNDKKNMLQNLMNNPECMKSMMEMMPNLQEEMEDNPNLKAVMNSSGFQEEMLNMTSDPNYMKEQMKNFDLTVSKLENMPGGFNMINSMLKDVQQPFTRNVTYKEGEKREDLVNKPLPTKNVVNKENWLLKYREELSLLRSMGFDNARNNLNALMMCNGNVSETIEYLTKNNKTF